MAMEVENDDYSIDYASPPLPKKTLEKFAAKSQLDFEIEFYEGILRRRPTYLEALRVLGNNLSTKGEHRASLEIDQRIARLCPGDHVAQYNLACSYSLVNEIDLALEALERAVEQGFREIEYMKQDHDLDNLRKDPRFRRILDAIEAETSGS